MERTGQIRHHHYSAPVGNELYKGHTKSRCAFVTHVSLLGMGDVPAFMIKGDMRAFMMGGGMGDAPTFMIRGDVPLETCVSFAFIIRDA
jgi:hypothetical protein